MLEPALAFAFRGPGPPPFGVACDLEDAGPTELEVPPGLASGGPRCLGACALAGTGAVTETGPGAAGTAFGGAAWDL